MRVQSKIGNDLARRTAQVAESLRIRDATGTKPELRLPREQFEAEHGRNIFVYSHLQTKQVVYSLTKTLKNNAALRQLPYNGKKTVPRALRKDHWSPMAQITFPASPRAGQLGLSTFQKLREYRTLHETLWPAEFTEGLSRKARGKKLCDQKANTVADMASALKLVVTTEPGVIAEQPEKVVVNGLKAADMAKGAGEENVEAKEAQEEESTQPVRAKISWVNILDAEFAESWPEGVVHDIWEAPRNNRKAPLVEYLSAAKEPVKVKAEVPAEELHGNEAAKVML